MDEGLGQLDRLCDVYDRFLSDPMGHFPFCFPEDTGVEKDGSYGFYQHTSVLAVFLDRNLIRSMNIILFR